MSTEAKPGEVVWADECWHWETLTNELRFMGGKLQQRVRISWDKPGKGGDCRYEWREVPSVEPNSRREA